MRRRSDLLRRTMSGATNRCFLVGSSPDDTRPRSFQPASFRAWNRVLGAMNVPGGAIAARRAHTACHGPPTTPLANSPRRVCIRSSRYPSAADMLLSTRLRFQSVMGGADAGLNADTSRAYSQAAHASNPPDLYQVHRRTDSSGDRRPTVDQTANQRRSCDGSVIGT